MLLETIELTKEFQGQRNGRSSVTAVSKANIYVEKGETIGLFGESGSGKSTLGLMVSGLLKPTGGTIFYKDEPVKFPYKGEIRRNIQILFQHPEVSFNPALPLIKSMEEPYKVYGLPFSKNILEKDIAPFGLRFEHMERLPAELSGGELQRAALARILVMKPELIVLDEPTSMLDVITQAQMIDMLRRIQQDYHTTYLFITHNRALSESFCDRIYAVENGILKENVV